MKATENDVTPEEIFLNRREILGQFGLGLGMAATLGPLNAMATVAGNPAKLNPKFDPKDALRPLTSMELATKYNNFYEFSLEKDEVHKKVEKWKLGKWTLDIAGHINNKKTWDVEDLVKKLGVEERIYRFRCVEAWSMVVPWTGFPLQKLIALVEPTSKAKYIKFTSFNDRGIGTNMDSLLGYPWPYTEGLTLAEANHPLAMMVSGMYGKPLPKQNGAPLRLIVPWKYGFKSIKSVTKIEFVEERPIGLWEALAPKEYGFYANVNPQVDHPRWSQASERILDGSFFPKKVKTLMFNGYEQDVAHLYAGLDLTKNY